MKRRMVILVLAVFSLSCSDSGTTRSDRRFNLSLKFGVGARNVLNTFNDTFTKDLVLDEAVTTNLVLSPAELDSIEARFLSINIFGYPDKFVVPHGDTVWEVTPYTTYVLTLKRDGQQKTLYWADSLKSSDERATELRSVLRFVITLTLQRPEYKSLPHARGAYQ